MRLERTENGFQIDAVALGPLLGVPADDVQRLMREGRIASLCEEGRGEDEGRHRITFRHGAIRVRLTVNDAGGVLLRTRARVAPRPGTPVQVEPGISGESRSGCGAGDASGDGFTDLTQRIESRFHARHRRRLRELGKLAEMVEDLHEDDEGVPAGLRRALGRIGGALEAHMRSAECVVFPMIRSGATSGLGSRIEALRSDHARLTAECARIREISRDFELPDGACTSWVTLYAGLAEFIDSLAEHVRLENDVLRPPEPGAGADA
ncbi:DUF6522 family protein [Amaricoccus sp.]|uniref:DUF6522 family protein n=1 Tax=Amaricoccus sp. TaxID=1872485 RepID=UPI00262C46DA|nr:DUF6522 family protein [Amaricoccus sp.]HRO10945.1 DUF6522 family protein [Amaricoccus sp.]